MKLVLAALLMLLAASAARAGNADVQAVQLRCRPAPGGRAASICHFSVTVKHADSGWDHYANRFEIVKLDGELISKRILRHPHVDEQPFTRGLGRVRIMHDVERVEVRAGDLVHGLGGATVIVEIPHAIPEAREP